ncbi:asparagine synthase-related protein [Thermodesulfovibrio hydrogeniphilus]
MTKIVGFLITKQKVSVDIDFFKKGLNLVEFRHADYFVYLWGIGDIINYKISDKYSLSYPLHDSLFDRNVLITLVKDKIIIENDWLGSIPIFYNPKYSIVSTLPNFCIKEKKFHNEGLVNFCQFGYSVFEQTIFEEVKFLRFYSKLIITKEGITVEYKEDPILQEGIFDKKTTPTEVIEKVRYYINNIEQKINGEIIIPTSGGFDSRMLNYLISDKSRIRSFTYGISADQSKSYEVVYAKKISEILNTKWEQIELSEFHRYIKEWFSIYGISTHLHGMYHIEFYSKILQKHYFQNPTLLSGIVGDAWAGSIRHKPIKCAEDLVNLGYTHGIQLDLRHLEISYFPTLKMSFYEKYKKALEDDRLKTVFTIRLKIILISYLTQIPEYFGIPVWTPFLNFEIVKSTLSLPEEQRKNRKWERDFFKSVGLGLEDMGLKCVKSNKLDYEIAKKTSFESLDVERMQRYISKKKG